MFFTKFPSKISLLLLVGSLFFACGKDDAKPSGGKYSNGVFIVNEGPFQNGTGTVSFFDSDSLKVSNDIFGKENASALLGNIAQSMTIHEGKAYVVVNNANKIEIADAETFKSVGKITGLALPRYFLPISTTKALVSQWGANGLDGSLAIVDLTSNAVAKTVAIGKGPEKMILEKGKIYVALSGGFGDDKRIAVFNPSTETVEKYIELPGDNPTSLVADASGTIWTVCRGATDWVNPTKSTPGKLFSIINDAVSGNGIELANGADNLVISPSKTTIYFTSGGKVYAHSASSSAAQPSLFSDKNIYSLGVDPATGNVWLADAKDFSSPGEVTVLDRDGNQVRSFEAGITPAEFWFQ